MYIYLLFFFLSFLCIGISKKIEKKKKISLFFELLGIFLLSLLAGVRDISIGTDVEVYVKPVFDLLMENYSFSNVSSLFNIECGYVFFNHVILMFSNSFSVFLFVVQFFIIGFSYFGIKKVYPKNYFLIYIIFIFIFYNRSLNIVRQAMAISLVLFSLKYLLDGKNKRFFFIIFLAYLFHKSSLVFIIAYFIYKFLNKRNVNEIIMANGIIIVSMIFMFAFPKVINMLVGIGLLSSKYTYYLTNYVLESLDFNYFELILNSILIILYLLFIKVYHRKDGDSKFYFLLLVIDTMCLLIASRYVVAYRIGMYFKIPSVLYFLSNFEIIMIEKNNKHLIANFLGILVAVVFWYVMFVIGKDGQTIPFIFS